MATSVRNPARRRTLFFSVSPLLRGEKRLSSGPSQRDRSFAGEILSGKRHSKGLLRGEGVSNCHSPRGLVHQSFAASSSSLQMAALRSRPIRVVGGAAAGIQRPTANFGIRQTFFLASSRLQNAALRSAASRRKQATRSASTSMSRSDRPASRIPKGGASRRKTSDRITRRQVSSRESIHSILFVHRVAVAGGKRHTPADDGPTHRPPTAGQRPGGLDDGSPHCPEAARRTHDSRVQSPKSQ